MASIGKLVPFFLRSNGRQKTRVFDVKQVKRDVDDYKVGNGGTHRLLRRDVYDNRLSVAGVFTGGEKGAKRRR